MNKTAPRTRSHGRLNPVAILLAMLMLAGALTHVIPAGKFDHRPGPGTANFHVVPKVNGIPALASASLPKESEKVAHAAGVVSFFAAIPAGMAKSVNTIFMVLFVGGMFGVLRATGTLDASIDRLLHLTSGNVYLLTAALMLVLACGSTFLGFISEYLVLIPLVLVVGERLRLPNLFAPAVVAVSGMVGYAASVTNPIVLAVAQPLAGVPVFSGALPRLVSFIVLFVASLIYVLLYLRRLPKFEHRPEATRLSIRQCGVLLTILAGGAGLIIGTSLWSWETTEHSAVFVALAIALAAVGGLNVSEGAEAFLDGMKAMLMAAVMIGLAGAMDIVLRSSQVLDTIVYAFGTIIQGQTPGFVASGIMVAEMLLDVLLHSTSAKAAITLPILAPIAGLAGVSGQVSVSALTLGGGLTNLITPTNGLLLAFLSTSKVSYGEWARFIAPLFLILCLIGFATLWAMTGLGL